LCARETDAEFNKKNRHHLSTNLLSDMLPPGFVSNLDKMFLCGNYGDPAAGLHTLDLYRWFRKQNAHITLGMNTNGAIGSTDWWRQLADLLNQPKDYVVFSIDGLEDTNELYRINVNWQKVMHNAQVFIDAGGSAHWDMLVYAHNQHQVDACEELARNMGFKWFRAKVSKRPLVKHLEYPIQWITPTQYQGRIQCHALDEQSIYIDAQGRVSPCCWLGSRQNDFVQDFDQIKQSWVSDKPNSICVSSCGVKDQTTNFLTQWRKEIAL
jgi:MoaA/NifB/PqqE/SkfB family radical SAM enzyme